ncbi:unnamed protein product [marine sediment metagenome]|uniref:SUF system FeS cluster assembly SufBD core domain-containing protein n=1 Tax=marine sediment metagenome TaxID=412755 RepID=X1BHX5_9ZZZZ
MIDYKIDGKSVLIKYSVEESFTNEDPLFLQSLFFDLPFDLNSYDFISINIDIAENIFVYVIDDLHFSHTKNNKIEFKLRESSQLFYRLFVANHRMCDVCQRKEFSYCQTLPEKFEKEINVDLNGEHSGAYVKCHYLGDKTSYFKIKTSQNHKVSNTTSKLLVKSILDDQSQMINESTIFVDKNLENINSEQNNKNLLIGTKSKVRSIPNLKINSKKVNCKHGATFRNLDSEELFYLQSRGIDKSSSERMLIDAFLNT